MATPGRLSPVSHGRLLPWSSMPLSLLPPLSGRTTWRRRREPLHSPKKMGGDEPASFLFSLVSIKRNKETSLRTKVAWEERKIFNSFTCNSSRSDDGAALGAENDADFKVHVLSSSEVLDRLHDQRISKAETCLAMYSSIFGGIVFDPAMMAIPVDDHMVHRGHGVFDTGIIFDGYLYELDAHLDRLLRSASAAKIISPFSRATLRSILLQLTAASSCRKGRLRYWLSAGPGDFFLSPAACHPAFYAVVIEDDFFQCKQGVEVITSTIPMKAPLFATMKNVNYLPNVLSKMEAEASGAFSSLWVDGEGCIAEGPNMNVAFITHDKELILPPFRKILQGCTAKRLLELAPVLIEQGRLKSVRVADLRVEEAKWSAEMMYAASGLPLLPIIKWDGEPVGDGRVGELTMALSDLLWRDMLEGPESHRTLVP